MADSVAIIWIVLIVGWFVCISSAGDIAAQRHCRGTGVLLGLIFGPLGVIAAGFLDARPQCPNCGERRNGTRQQPFPVCPHCQFQFLAPRPVLRDIPAPRPTIKQAEPPTPLPPEAFPPILDDPAWKDDLEAARKLLAETRCVGLERE